MRLVSALPADRRIEGVLTVTDDGGGVLYGPVRCKGKADSQIAAMHGNANRDPTRQFGDHPTGTYSVAMIQRGKLPPRSYGTAFMLLQPISGDAAKAERKGREGLAIHGGDPGADGSLRATEGCLRLSNFDAGNLADLVEPELGGGAAVLYECREA